MVRCLIVSIFLAAGSAMADIPQLPPVAPWLSGLDQLEATTMLPADFSRKSGAPPIQRSLTDRIRADFELTRIETRDMVAERNWYVRHPEYLERVFQRGERYLYFIAEALEERGMPAEIALLPIVESAFDPFAYSHGRAAGLWQIIPGTGRRFGLSQNWWYDGRRDVSEATRAALDYLELLARRYDGDWLLAIAAYNSGEGNVDKAIRANRKQGKAIDFDSLSPRLPRETRAYVPKLMALADIVANPEQFDIALPVIADKPTFEIIPVESQLDLALAAGLAGIDIDTLYSFNPGFNQWATAPDGPHKLLIPTAYADRFRVNFSRVPESERMRYERHQVRPGQTLSEIAELHGTSTKSIRDANKLGGSFIKAGNYLLVPASTAPLATYTQSADQRLNRLQSRSRTGKRVTHLVQSGESFWTLARRYSVDVRSLAKWNGMAPGDTLSAGRTLVVWTKVEDDGTEGARDSRTRRLSYTIRSGDSLSLIAARFRVGIADLMRWNDISATSILRPGQRLRLYVDVTRQSS